MTTRGKYPSKYKPEESVEFDSKINSALNSFKSKFNKFNSSYNTEEHYIVADYVFYMPVLIKSKKRISKTGGDVDNLIKPLQDLLFKRLDADDSEIISVTSTKVHSDNYSIKISLKAYSLNTIK